MTQSKTVTLRLAALMCCQCEGELPQPATWVAWWGLEKNLCLYFFWRRVEPRDHFGKVTHGKLPCRAAIGMAKGRCVARAASSFTAHHLVLPPPPLPLHPEQKIGFAAD